jgi:glycosyltransferase involved in cell wall biosynthesis
MRIGIIAPPWLPVPPPAYGGTEQVIDDLARGLQDLGHNVRLFTVGASTCPVPREYLYPAVSKPMGDGLAEAAHVLAAYQAFAGVDIIHDQTMLGPLLAASRGARRPPTVTTNHGPFTAQTRRLFADIARHTPIVAISHSHARTAGVPIAAVIHHGIDLHVHRPGPGDGGYLLFVGRMCADKGVHHAVRVAKRAGQRLVIVAKMREPDERAYFEEQVRPLLEPGDDLLAEVSLAAKMKLMRHAAALLNPITWAEPFGLVMAEALAAGTPVLAFPNGAAPEIVDDGQTGFLCHGEQEMIAAVGRVPQIRRDDCRAAAEQRFSAERMVADYERLYRRTLLRSGDLASRRRAGPDPADSARERSVRVRARAAS